MRGDPRSSVYCGSICEDICSSAEDIRGAIGVTTSDCWSVGVVLVSLFSRYFFGFRFDFFLPLGRCDDCGSISKPCFSLSSANFYFPMDRALFIRLACLLLCRSAKEGPLPPDAEPDW